MTRINTNVSSLNAQKTLARSNAQLQEALTRLSTGLRINVGKDDPAGLIASEVLRSNIVSTQRAITNSERANQMIATADSALGQVSSLLNDIRALISEATNTGAMSEEQIAANQLQLDSSLEAIDRIAQVTQFQGKRLLDGNLDFVTTGVSASQITDLKIEQANFGTLSEIAVSVDVVSQAEKAELQYAANTVTDTNGVVLEVGGTKGFEAFSFAYGSSVAAMADAINLVSDALGVQAIVGRVRATADGTGSMNATSPVADADITLTAVTAGRSGGDIAVKFVKGAAGASSAVTYTPVADGTDTMSVTLGTSAWAAASASNMEVGGAGVTIDLAARFAGSEFEGVQLVVDDVVAANEYAYYDYVNKKIHVALTAAAAAPNDLVTLINNPAFPSVSRLFVASDPQGGAVTAGTKGTITGATDGGVLTDSASAIAAAIDADPTALQYIDAASTGSGTVQPFQMSAYYGTANIGRPTDTNDFIQFLGPDGLRTIPIRFVKGAAGESLQVTLDQKLGFNGKSKLVYQDSAANASFQIEANNVGSDWNGVTLEFVTVTAASERFATYAPDTKRIVIGKLNTTTAAEAVDLINNDPIVKKYFTASVLGAGGTTISAGAGVYGGVTPYESTGGEQPYTGITVRLATDSSGTVTTTAGDLVTYANTGSNPFTQLGISVSNAGNSDGTGLLAATTSDITFSTNGQVLTNRYAQGTSYNRGGENARMLVRALNPGGAYDDVRVVFADTATAGNETFSYNATDKTLTIGIQSGVSTLAQVLARFTPTNYPTEYALFNITAVNGTSGTLYDTDFATLTGGVVNTGASNGVTLLGNYDEGDYIGTDGLRFVSTDYGSQAFVSVKALQGTFNVTDKKGVAADRDYGQDVDVRINGIQAIGDGLKATINTSVLDMNMTLADTVEAGSTIQFTIVSGGAQFQLGPEVVSNQQARLGITSLSTVKLGSSAGRLFQLRSGGPYDLQTDALTAAQIVNDVINQVTTLRGRLGAFQRTTLQTNINSLNDTLEALTDAESSIRDADFAAESARLTRAQILVQSGISVLSIANSNPQNVLALLR